MIQQRPKIPKIPRIAPFARAIRKIHIQPARALTNKYLGEGEDFATKYGEVMTLFCEGHFGFGEIDKGLGIALAAGVDAAEVIALRDSWYGLGQHSQRI